MVRLSALAALLAGGAVGGIATHSAYDSVLSSHGAWPMQDFDRALGFPLTEYGTTFVGIGLGIAAAAVGTRALVSLYRWLSSH